MPSENDLTQIHLRSNRLFIVQGSAAVHAKRWREALEAGELLMSFVNRPAQEMFPSTSIWVRVDEIEDMIEESAEAWAFQQQLEADRYREWSQQSE